MQFIEFGCFLLISYFLYFEMFANFLRIVSNLGILYYELENFSDERISKKRLKGHQAEFFVSKPYKCLTVY